MRSASALVGGATVVVLACVAATVIGRSGAAPQASAAPVPAPTTDEVVRGPLATSVAVSGTLGYRARADGTPYPAINQARGTYTALPGPGAAIGCGDELYRVDDRPVLLLCGAIPAYRDLHAGDTGNDVRQLNANLHDLGYDAATGDAIDPAADAFTERTEQALEALQRDRGADVTGTLAVGGALVLPEPVRVAAVTGQAGGPALPGAPVLDATSATLEVRVALTGSEQGAVHGGERALIVLPGNTSATGTVDRVGTVAVAAGGPGDPPAPATIPVAIGLDDPGQVQGLDHAPVRVEITTEGVADALSVPVLAVVGRSGGGFAIEVVHADGGRALVAVELGLVDTSVGRVQVTGDVREGDDVVVPGS